MTTERVDWGKIVESAKKGFGKFRADFLVFIEESPNWQMVELNATQGSESF